MHGYGDCPGYGIWCCCRAQSMDRQDRGPEAAESRCQALRRYFAECCDRYIGERPVKLGGMWARMKLGPDRLNTRMAFVLQQLTDNPEDFGLRDLRLENDDWLDQFALQLSEVPLVWDEPSDVECDRRIQYLVLCWLVCVERGSAWLQRSIRRAMALEDTKKLDAFQYLAAAAVLLLRNTQLSWPEAVFAFRRKFWTWPTTPNCPPHQKLEQPLPAGASDRRSAAKSLHQPVRQTPRGRKTACPPC